ncbi:MAG: PAS domain-containing protein [Epsilonproteobacteria bacterium]|nr:PAS domain-containing protein [Campylobacterota bacterium]OIO15894.1 MAG: PAS sensor protein [Helicobacteraceae bacterium CG1_02_36_14]PIP11497.1 MAG: PAS sensor protein [Sulfurimonas sp. CG23_combo_of_CG06-09_8_20_14_all_36_33]PIS24767.1 MAG: PAS sensor protein [Sulfurimonas sp. CG08_land_8_20_14_0_20_36_33]PIU35942.1 MAG: PAS sensor protein [Sulfurimonas sp. CG07_land_8_20_14_0_80_36_56]PIV04549.1 MAG: PAS sensor protein [Sulfurimonas sp. CG03_land_8_20_14_0_80_36_25]PIV33902.1 MAG: PAS 
MVLELGKDDFIISKTDLKGKITYVNQTFMKIAEYTEEELIDKPHSIIRHPSMPKAVFKLLWDTIVQKEEIFAFVLNKTKNGNEYWVYANVTASLDENGKIVGYYSVRRKPNPEAIEIIKPLYAKMLETEKRSGVEASTKILIDILNEEGVSYNELIISIQK